MAGLHHRQRAVFVDVPVADGGSVADASVYTLPPIKRRGGCAGQMGFSQACC
jgi:hypothetical protein